MNPLRLAPGFRIGSVPYLNARPLAAALDHPVLAAHPAELASALARGDLDAALVPIFFPLAHPGYRLVDGCGIVSRGPVWSVILASRRDPQAARSVALDPASLSSAHMLRALEGELFDAPPRYLPGDDPSADARLLIGSQAIAFRREAGPGWHLLDLGERWGEITGLPFVYAVWALGPDAPISVADTLREAASRRGAFMEKIAASDPDPHFAREYLDRFIAFDIGPGEKKGIAEYRRRLAEKNLLPAQAEELIWV